MKMLNNINIAIKLPVAILTLILFAAAGTGMFSYLGAKNLIAEAEREKHMLLLESYVEEVKRGAMASWAI